MKATARWCKKLWRLQKWDQEFKVCKGYSNNLKNNVTKTIVATKIRWKAALYAVALYQGCINSPVMLLRLCYTPVQNNAEKQSLTPDNPIETAHTRVAKAKLLLAHQRVVVSIIQKLFPCGWLPFVKHRTDSHLDKQSCSQFCQECTERVSQTQLLSIAWLRVHVLSGLSWKLLRSPISACL